jgi:large subunit ribosomal protein L5
MGSAPEKTRQGGGVIMANLQEHYRKNVVEPLVASGKYKNRLAVPRVKKVVINMGVSASLDKDAINEAAAELGIITGQKPLVTKAKRSISNFKVRKGQSVGCKVTLRGARMYEFLERLIVAALPRIRDFRGISPRGFDGRGNYTLGVREQTIFPEIELDKVKHTMGMDITIVTTARSNEQAREMLKLLGLPFAEAK